MIIELSDPTLLKTKDGSILPIDDSSAPIRDENGRVIGVALVFRDITERKKAETEILRLNRVYSVLSNISQAIVRIRNYHKSVIVSLKTLQTASRKICLSNSSMI